MPSLWIWLSLLYALQSSVSSDDAVSLNCSDTVEVKAGETVTLNCTIELKEENCRVLTVYWMSTNDKNLCTNGSLVHRYSCTSDNETYVSLTITNVTKEENITVEIFTTKGMDDSLIKVKLTGMSPICNNTAGDNETLNCTNEWQSNQENWKIYSSHDEEDQERIEEDIKLALFVTFGLLATAIVVATLYFLFKTDRCCKITKSANQLLLFSLLPANDRGSYSSTPQA